MDTHIYCENVQADNSRGDISDSFEKRIATTTLNIVKSVSRFLATLLKAILDPFPETPTQRRPSPYDQIHVRGLW